MGYSRDLSDKERDLIQHHFATGKYGSWARRSLVGGVLYSLDKL